MSVTTPPASRDRAREGPAALRPSRAAAARREALLDHALEASFPASDPIGPMRVS